MAPIDLCECSCACWRPKQPLGSPESDGRLCSECDNARCADDGQFSCADCADQGDVACPGPYGKGCGDGSGCGICDGWTRVMCEACEGGDDGTD